MKEISNQKETNNKNNIQYFITQKAFELLNNKVEEIDFVEKTKSLYNSDSLYIDTDLHKKMEDSFAKQLDIVVKDVIKSLYSIVKTKNITTTDNLDLIKNNINNYMSKLIAGIKSCVYQEKLKQADAIKSNLEKSAYLLRTMLLSKEEVKSDILSSIVKNIEDSFINLQSANNFFKDNKIINSKNLTQFLQALYNEPGSISISSLKYNVLDINVNKQIDFLINKYFSLYLNVLGDVNTQSSKDAINYFKQSVMIFKDNFYKRRYNASIYLYNQLKYNLEQLYIQLDNNLHSNNSSNAQQKIKYNIKELSDFISVCAGGISTRLSNLLSKVSNRDGLEYRLSSLLNNVVRIVSQDHIIQTKIPVQNQVHVDKLILEACMRILANAKDSKYEDIYIRSTKMNDSTLLMCVSRCLDLYSQNILEFLTVEFNSRFKDITGKKLREMDLINTNEIEKVRDFVAKFFSPIKVDVYSFLDDNNDSYKLHDADNNIIYKILDKAGYVESKGKLINNLKSKGLLSDNIDVVKYSDVFAVPSSIIGYYNINKLSKIDKKYSIDLRYIFDPLFITLYKIVFPAKMEGAYNINVFKVADPEQVFGFINQQLKKFIDNLDKKTDLKNTVFYINKDLFLKDKPYQLLCLLRFSIFVQDHYPKLEFDIFGSKLNLLHWLWTFLLKYYPEVSSCEELYPKIKNHIGLFDKDVSPGLSFIDFVISNVKSELVTVSSLHTYLHIMNKVEPSFLLKKGRIELLSSRCMRHIDFDKFFKVSNSFHESLFNYIFSDEGKISKDGVQFLIDLQKNNTNLLIYFFHKSVKLRRAFFEAILNSYDDLSNGKKDDVSLLCIEYSSIFLTFSDDPGLRLFRLTNFKFLICAFFDKYKDEAIKNMVSSYFAYCKTLTKDTNNSIEFFGHMYMAEFTIFKNLVDLVNLDPKFCSGFNFYRKILNSSLISELFRFRAKIIGIQTNKYKGKDKENIMSLQEKISYNDYVIVEGLNSFLTKVTETDNIRCKISVLDIYSSLTRVLANYNYIYPNFTFEFFDKNTSNINDFLDKQLRRLFDKNANCNKELDGVYKIKLLELLFTLIHSKQISMGLKRISLNDSNTTSSLLKLVISPIFNLYNDKNATDVGKFNIGMYLIRFISCWRDAFPSFDINTTLKEFKIENIYTLICKSNLNDSIKVKTLFSDCLNVTSIISNKLSTEDKILLFKLFSKNYSVLVNDLNYYSNLLGCLLSNQTGEIVRGALQHHIDNNKVDFSKIIDELVAQTKYPSKELWIRSEKENISLKYLKQLLQANIDKKADKKISQIITKLFSCRVKYSVDDAGKCYGALLGVFSNSSDKYFISILSNLQKTGYFKDPKSIDYKLVIGRGWDSYIIPNFCRTKLGLTILHDILDSRKDINLSKRGKKSTIIDELTIKSIFDCNVIDILKKHIENDKDAATKTLASKVYNLITSNTKIKNKLDKIESRNKRKINNETKSKKKYKRNKNNIL